MMQSNIFTVYGKPDDLLVVGDSTYIVLYVQVCASLYKRTYTFEIVVPTTGSSVEGGPSILIKSGVRNVSRLWWRPRHSTRLSYSSHLVYYIEVSSTLYEGSNDFDTTVIRCPIERRLTILNLYGIIRTHLV